jgi:hypothetical protein
MSIERANTPSGTGWHRTSYQALEPSAKWNSVSPRTGTRSSRHRRIMPYTSLCSMPGHASCIVRPSSSLFGRRLCTAAVSFR